MTGFLCALPLLAGLLSCPRRRRARGRLCRGRVRPARAGQLGRARRGRGAPGRPRDHRPAGRPPGADRRRDRPRRGRGGAGRRPRPSSPTCARAAAPRRSPSPRRRSRPRRSASREAQRQAERQTALARRNVVSQANLDTAIAERDTAQTEVKQLHAQLAVERLPGARSSSSPPPRAGSPAPRPRCDDARWQLDKRTLTAPVDGEVTDVFRRVGEIAGPTDPVVSILPDGAYKLVVFVGETAVAGLAPGTVLAVRCDGCPDGLTATVSYVSDEPEFTPPVIYSVENRQKLVYRVEARPAAGRAGAAPRPDRRRRPWRSDRDARDRHRRPPPDQALRRPRRRRRRVDDRQPRRDRRLPRAERLGQDHDDPA